jgi:cysteine-rich repeat protein
MSCWAAAVPARANYPGSIPNGFSSGAGRCYVCHIDPDGGGPRTSFGVNFERGPDGVAGNTDDHVWSTWLAARDSDGDGWTNGQELGDPFRLWSSGSTPPYGYLSNPGTSQEPTSSLNMCGSSARHDCASTADCVDSTSGSGQWSCDCDPGYTGTGHRRTTSHSWTSGVRQRYTIVGLTSGCSDINECSTPGRCGTAAAVSSCQNLSGTYRCNCRAGYDAPSTGGTCTDVNECTASPGICGVGSCSNSPAGAYTCTCPTGYDFNGTTCVVENACTAGTDDCSRNATCTAVGMSGWNCTCRAGWRGTGSVANGTGDICVDIDECTVTPRICGAGTCANTSGNYRCTCPPGYEGEDLGGTCVDIDECMTMPGICGEGTCTDRNGSYTCACPAGYTFDGTTCLDIDECAAAPCGPGECVQSFPPPGYGCACPAGYDFDGTTCIDVNECADPVLNVCSANAECANTTGTFTCTCDEGFEGDGFNCMDIGECSDPSLNDCHVAAICTNTVGAYSCACREGYEGSGIQCEDVDECARGTHGCDANEVCVNREGLPNECPCAPGFARPAEGAACVASCGDGARTSGEACDDANTEEGDGCSALCEIEPGWACFEPSGVSECDETCGDGLIHEAEECDDGGANSDTAIDACRTSCRRAHCGDGVLDSGESCDDGGANPDTAPDACRLATCAPASCGDGVLDTGESCDPGGGDRAQDDCVSRCGDFVDAGTAPPPLTDGGCGCRAAHTSGGGFPLALLVLALALRHGRGVRRHLRRLRRSWQPVARRN